LPYQKQQYLGGGFFGKVWLEMDTALGRPCAAKYLEMDFVSSSTKSFAEAQMMVAAEHDHVVAVYSAELEGKQPVIRMEYLPNGSVADNYCGNPVPVAEAIRIMEDACRGIAHLHIRGILHRDIKPANLLLTATGSVKVSDFGLSHPIANLGHASPAGYYRHVPPEAAGSGSGITSIAGDVYAAGVTAYRLLNGDQALKGIVAPGADYSGVIAKGKYPDRALWQPHIHDPSGLLTWCLCPVGNSVV
jgi:serine/threonine protein kinase